MLAAAAMLAGAGLALSAPADALGTARIQLPDGSVKTYTNVHIAVRDASLWMTSSDGKGTVIIGKAACTKVDELVKCLPYDATLDQFGERHRIVLKSGTAWFNPTATKQTLPLSSTQIPPHGIVLEVRSKRGTYVSLTGTVDDIAK